MRALTKYLPNGERRERWHAFVLFLWRRFIDDKCFEAAGALSYTTIFALVPLTTMLVGIIAAFPVFDQWSAVVTDFVFENFVPATGKIVQSYLRELAGKASQLTVAGTIALVVSALLLMSSVEHTYNLIWRAPPRRRRIARFVIYWTVLTLSPLLAAASIALSSLVLAEVVSGSNLRLHEHALALLPKVVTWVALTLSYLMIPNTAVRVRNAVLGALLATLLFEAAKRGFVEYLGRANFDQVYGVLAAIPIFLVWIYVSWTVVLLGASLAATLGAFRFQPAALRVPAGLEFAALLRVLRHIATAARLGTGYDRAQLAAREPGLTDEQLDRFLAELTDARMIQRTDRSTWVLLRDPAEVNLQELFEPGRHRWPTHQDMRRLHRAAAADDPILLWLERSRVPLQSALARPLAEMLVVPPNAPALPFTEDSAQ